MIHDGRFLQSEFVFEQDGKKSTGLGLVGFDPFDRAIHDSLDRLTFDQDVTPAEPGTL